MTAIINCRDSTIKGGFRRIQQCRGKSKTEGKPRTEFSMKNTAGRVTETRTPKSTCADDTAVHHSPDLQSSLQGSLIHCTTAQCGMTGLHHQQNHWQVPVPRNCATKLQGQRICYAVCINCTAKTTTDLWKTSIWNPTDFMIFQKPYPQTHACSKMAYPSLTQNLLSHT